MLKLSEQLKQNEELPVSYSRGSFCSLARRELEIDECSKQGSFEINQCAFSLLIHREFLLLHS